MSYSIGTYKGAFWETDFQSNNGFTALSNHMKNGQKSTKWIEEYLKQRAKAEEDYSKTLLKISRNAPTDFGTFGKFVFDLHRELEAEAALHASLASNLQEEIAKLSEFREKQKDEKRRNEDIVQKAHKTKVDMFRAMNNCKKECESRVKSAEKAELDFEKSKAGAKPKDIEKAKKNHNQSKQNATKANENYKSSVSTLENSRQNWENEHAKMCDVFQNMEVNRISCLRNIAWIFSNLISDMCCKLDDSRENIRLAAEKCNAEDDVRNFALTHKYCSTPPQAISYVAPGMFENNSTDLYSVVGTNGTKLSAPKHSDDEWEDETDYADTYTAQYDFSPSTDSEMGLTVGEQVRIEGPEHQGWVKAISLTSHNKGLVPLSYLQASCS